MTNKPNKFAALGKRESPDAKAVEAFVAGADTRSTTMALQEPAEMLKQINVRVSKARWLTLRNYCAEQDITLQDFVVNAIDQLPR